MIENLLAMYDKGAITADHLAVQCLLMIDPRNPGPVLASLPSDIQARVIQFANAYESNHMRTNYGLTPALDQVEAAKLWLQSSSQPATGRR